MAKMYLHLEDGTTLAGEGFGAAVESSGEVVFSTGMTGYTESLTDPSFAGQILTFTYPMIGNYGVPKSKRRAAHLMENFESERIWVAGVICSEISSIGSHADAFQTFSQWLASEKIPGIRGIDTRALTQKIREHGVMRGWLSNSKLPPDWKKFSLSPLVPAVSTKQKIVYTPKKPNKKHIVLIDCGVKHAILRSLLDLGYRVTRIPWDADPLAEKKIDAVLCSNGPGDPKDCPQTIAHIKKVIAANIPFLGICLGHQLLSLAVGADTYKLRYGHRGLNQPCLDLTTNRAYVTSQNHGYAVDRKTIPAGYVEWFINLNDNTSEGIKHKTKPIRSVQFHPEGNPGPFDTDWIFASL